jgi:hypothetical protein
MDDYTKARQERIAEDVISLIDYTSRVLGAVEGGNWHYATDKIHGLRKALDSLERHIDRDSPNQPGKLDQIRGETVWARVRLGARDYWLGRAIFGRANVP